MTPRIMNKTNCSASDIIRRILEEITLHPDKIKITNNRIGRGLTDMVIESHPGDTPRVIGQGGKHSRSIFLLVSMIGRKSGESIRCRIPDPEIRIKEPNKPFVPKDPWNNENVLTLANDICDAIFCHPSLVEIVDGPDFASALDISTDPEESEKTVEKAAECLTPLFGAIGKSNGRHLFVTVAPKESAIPSDLTDRL